MLRLLIIGLAIFFASVFVCSCFAQTIQSKKLAELKFTVAPAPEWDTLFTRYHGWFGGDGMFSVTLSGVEKEGAAYNDSVLLWFSDTMLGDIVNDSVQSGETMINNSIARLSQGKPGSNPIHFYWNTTTDNKTAAVFVPQTALTQKGEYYWLGDGFVNTEKNNDIYIFGYRIMNIPEKAVFGFKQTGNTLIHIPAGDQFPFEHTTQTDIPFLEGRDADSAGSFGAGILVNTKKAGAFKADGYLYIYGVRGNKKEVITARVKPGAIDRFHEWKFWNGKNWTSDVKDIQPIASRASNELSVTALKDGRYLMTFQKDAIGRQVAVRVGNSPVGPFGPIIDVYDVSNDLKDSPNFFSYNAKAHPVLSQPGELLISYHINSFDFAKDIKKFPHLYRPRFIKLKYE